MYDPQEEARILRTMIESAPTGFCNIGLDGRFLRANPKFCELIGYSLEELSSMTFRDITHPDERTRDSGAFQSMLRGERSTYQAEKRYIRKDGKVLWIELTSSLIRNDRNEPLYFVSIMHDISRRKHTEAALDSSENRFKTLFQQAPFSVQLLGPKGQTLQVNAAWERLWGVPKHSVEQFLFHEYNVFNDPQLKAKRVTSYIERAYAGESVVTEPILYDPKEIGQAGRPRWLMAFTMT